MLEPTSGTHKALALLSGGLDSLLAAKIILEQGIAVEGINFSSGFFGEGSIFKNARKQKKRLSNSYSPQWIADQLGISLHVVDVFDEFKNVLFSPRYGYGSELNPCLDCKIFMIKKALEWAEKENFDFLITGEVIGQRPMSQRKDTLPLIIKKAHATDRLVRPLSAQWLPPTLPEKMGWIDRNQLLDISGRSRKKQLELAAFFGFKHIPQPAGGCLLTDSCFANRLRDLWQARGEKAYDRTDIQLLKAGRHIRPKPHFKMIIGRDETDNAFLESYQCHRTYLICLDSIGPLALIDGILQNNDLELAASILAHYSREGKKGKYVTIECHDAAGNITVLSASPLSSYRSF